MSNRIIPKEMSGGLRKAELRDISGPQTAAPSTRRVPERPQTVAPSAPDPKQLAAARAEGYREGFEAGKAEGQAQAAVERAALGQLTDGLNQLIDGFEQRLAADVLSVSLELARLIVRQALSAKPELVLNVIREALHSLPGLDEQTTIYVHPADAALLKNSVGSDGLAPTLPWKVVEDARIERGGCRLETPTTEVNATVQARWRRIIAALGRDDAWLDGEV